MLTKVWVEGFKSLVDLALDLGQLNVFIGANGSGKSNLLEALGVLGTAASGRVDDESLLRRGVRPGVPSLYKTAFPGVRLSPHIKFGAEDATGASFEITLWNPLKSPSPAWGFKTENLRRSHSESIVVRSTRSAGKHNLEQGMAALETARLKPGDAALTLMDELRNYAIYCPNTPSLRGIVQDLQAREPVGLSGGRLPEGLGELLVAGKTNEHLEDLLDDVRGLIEWARSFSSEPSTEVALSPSAARSRFVIKFVDRFMLKDRNSLTGYDASEGALYVLFLAVLALHPKAPRCLAVDNVDQTLNPRLARRVMEAISQWVCRPNNDRQWLVTAHNPAVLDGLPLGDPKVRLFAVERDGTGHTVVSPIDLAQALAKQPDPSWTLSRMWMAGFLGAVPNV